MGGSSPLPDPADFVRSVYVHAPFCTQRCFYCDFAVTVSSDPGPADWLEALRMEMGVVEEEGRFTLAPELDTLFVGGGTPSFLGLGAMPGLVRILGGTRLGNPGLEWTVEANPDSFSRALARDWREAGVNRISFGVQSFQQGTLRWLNRLHGPEEAVSAVGEARLVGLDNLSLDLIFGLPAEVERDWKADLERTVALEMPHVSLYGLSVEKGTPLASSIRRGVVSVPSEEEYRDEFLQAADFLVSEGYRHYEVSNFSLPGHEARHNQAYWQHSPYLGLGNSSHSFSEGRRRWNVRDWGVYKDTLRLGKPPWQAEEVLTPAEFRLEEIWLSLRTDRGIEADALGVEPRGVVSRWVSSGLATVRDGVLRLTPAGWIVLDELVVELDLASE